MPGWCKIHAFWWLAATCRVVVAGEDAGSSYWIGVVLKTTATAGYLQNTHKQMRLLMRLPVT
jgi:hypothetical protein